MIQIKATNFMGESLTLSPDKYAIKKVSGLSPQGGTISTQKMGRHGTEYNSSTTDERNIVIDLNILGDVEANRDALYNAFPTSLPVTLDITTDKKSASIAGYVESCEVDFFEMITVGQISIICPDPFFKASTADYKAEAGPVSLYSSCPFESGYSVSVGFTEAVEGIDITNNTTEKILHIDGAFVAGDRLSINTEERTVMLNGGNAFNNKSGDWALLVLGENKITVSVPATITFTDRYIGL